MSQQKTMHNMKKRWEKRLSLESLESRQMMSAVSIAAEPDLYAAPVCTATNEISVDSSISSLQETSAALQSAAMSSSYIAGSDAYENNNTMSTAYNLGTVSDNRTITANVAQIISNKKDYDWFKFTLPGTGGSTSKVSLSYTHSTSSDLDLELYNTSGNRISFSAGMSGTETISLSGKAAGTYYVKVYNYKSSTVSVPYTLTVSHSGSTSSVLSSNLQASNGGSLSSSSVTKGNSVTVKTGTIKNVGTATSTAGSVNFYASTDSNITSSDTFLGSVSLAALKKNETKTVSLSVSTSQLNAGTYYVGWIVTSSNDSTTSNNTARCTQQLTVKAPAQITQLTGYKIDFNNTTVDIVGTSYRYVDLAGIDSIRFTSSSKATVYLSSGKTYTATYTYTSSTRSLSFSYSAASKTNKHVLTLSAVGNTTGTLSGKFYRNNVYAWKIVSCSYNMSK